VLRNVRSLVIAGVLALVVAPGASAGWAGGDPAHNYPLGQLPLACDTAPTGTACINAGVYYLDKARQKDGLPPYALPADFPSLTPPQQMFVLANLDRVAYGLPPIPGLTAELDADALNNGVLTSQDPFPSDMTYLNGYTANWAGAFDNAPMAYEAWVWDDGLGSGNIDCTQSDTSGCWGHRHDVLWDFAAAPFDPTDVVAMGAAAGNGPDGPAYTMLLVAGFAPDPTSGYPGYTPTYTYTWLQAVADGAGTNTYNPGTPDTTVCQVPAVVGKRLAAAKRAIAKAYCAVGKVVRVHSVYQRGIVIRQSPPPGETLAAGAKVKLTLSLGRRR